MYDPAACASHIVRIQWLHRQTGGSEQNLQELVNLTVAKQSLLIMLIVLVLVLLSMINIAIILCANPGD